MKCLIDGDILVYRMGFASEDETESITAIRTNDAIHNILNAFQTKDFEIYLSDGTVNTFRFKIWDQYKANRINAVKPKHYEFIKLLLIKKWGAIITPEQEADDALGINQTENTVICTIDKDLDQIAGHHFNFVQNKYYLVEEFEADRWFYMQLLMGDKTENVDGIYGIGPIKASKILAPCGSEEEMYTETLQAYRTWLKTANPLWGEEQEQNLHSLVLRNGQLLRIRRKADEIWQPPQIQNSELLTVQQ